MEYAHRSCEWARVSTILGIAHELIRASAHVMLR